jgi:PPK2 family polyphosphate:nucleotide phosphotransferase
MKLDIDNFRVEKSNRVRLDRWPTKVKPVYESNVHYKELLQSGVDELSDLQRLLYAMEQYAVLIIFQGMDAAGKDGTIRHIMSGVDPQGCEVSSFKQPSAEELRHDFLWRSTLKLPARGRIGIFNRSYYEEVLVVRVHPELLVAQNLPTPDLHPRRLWRQRYDSILALEEHLHRNGTRIVKIFLHLSKEEQRKRFLLRIDESDKNWKFSIADARERKSWHAYQHAYQECLSATSTKKAPWYVVPADDKDNARLIAGRIVIEVLKDLNLAYPRVTKARRQELLALRRELK